MRQPGNADSLPRFDGPLDLLLEAVRRQNVAIEDIAMAPLVAGFLEYMRVAAGCDLNLDMEWLHTAATLIHWKSQALLDQEVTGNPHPDPIRDELVRQLLEHRRQVAGELEQRHSVEGSRLSRGRGDLYGTVHSVTEDDTGVTVFDLIRQARDLERWIEQGRHDREHWRVAFGVDPDEVTVAKMLEFLAEQMQAVRVLDGNQLLQNQPVPRRVALFLGILELTQRGELAVTQDEIFGSIWLARP